MLFVDKHRPKTAKQVLNAQYNVMGLMSWLRSWNTPQRQFKAAMLSGPNGIGVQIADVYFIFTIPTGKTTLATLVCTESNIPNVLHVDSSKKRTKKALMEVSEAFRSRSIDAYATGKMQKAKPGAVVIDELDAMMTGAADRGGISQIASFVKTSCIPVICICNDPSKPSLRPLLPHCMHFRMQRPQSEDIVRLLSGICTTEKIRVDLGRLREIVLRSGCDVRHAINDLQFSLGNRNAVMPSEMEFGTTILHSPLNLDRMLSPFDLTMSMFGCKPIDSIGLGMKLYESDSMLGPMLIYENYVKISQGDDMSTLCSVIDSISEGDGFEWSGTRKGTSRDVRSFMSCTIPCVMAGCKLNGRLDFPALLGKNSTKCKNERISTELAGHIVGKFKGTSNISDFVMDVLPALSHMVVNPFHSKKSQELKRTDPTLVQRTVSILDGLGMNKGDWDAMQELSVVPRMIAPNVKTAIATEMKRNAHAKRLSMGRKRTMILDSKQPSKIRRCEYVEVVEEEEEEKEEEEEEEEEKEEEEEEEW
jgi:hypothetical protein